LGTYTSSTTIQSLLKLQNKAVKQARPTNHTTLEESFQHLNILSFPNFMHFQWVNSCTPIAKNYFQVISIIILFPSATFILIPQNYPHLTICFVQDFLIFRAMFPSEPSPESFQ